MSEFPPLIASRDPQAQSPSAPRSSVLTGLNSTWATQGFVWVVVTSYMAVYLGQAYTHFQWNLTELTVLYWAKHVIAAVLAVFLFFRLFFLDRSPAKKSLLISAVQPFALFFIFRIVSDLYFAGPRDAREVLLTASQDILIWAILVTFATEVDDETRRFAARVFCFVAVLLLAGFFANERIRGEDILDWRGRLSMGMRHSGELAGIVFVAIASCFTSGVSSSKVGRYLILPFLLGLGFMSGTRNFYLTLLVFFFVDFAFRRRIFGPSLVAVIYTVILTGALLFYWSYTGADEASSGRLTAWRLALKYGTRGWGALFGHRVDRYLYEQIMSSWNASSIGRPHLDNFYLETLLGYGGVGVLLLLYGVIRYFLQLRRFPDPCRHAIAILVALCCYAFFDSAFLTSGNVVSLYCWLEVSSGFRTSKIRDLDRGHPSGSLVRDSSVLLRQHPAKLGQLYT